MSGDGDVVRKFEAAVRVIENLPKNGTFQPSRALMLRFYSLFKQSRFGPCTSPRPSFWDVIGKAKWDAWTSLGNLSTDSAMSQYVEELKQVIETMPHTPDVADFLTTLGNFYELVEDPTDDGLAFVHESRRDEEFASLCDQLTQQFNLTSSPPTESQPSSSWVALLPPLRECELHCFNQLCAQPSPPAASDLSPFPRGLLSDPNRVNVEEGWSEAECDMFPDASTSEEEGDDEEEVFEVEASPSQEDLPAPSHSVMEQIVKTVLRLEKDVEHIQYRLVVLEEAHCRQDITQQHPAAWFWRRFDRLMRNRTIRTLSALIAGPLLLHVVLQWMLGRSRRQSR